jgi:hypothetical protein
VEIVRIFQDGCGMEEAFGSRSNCFDLRCVNESGMAPSSASKHLLKTSLVCDCLLTCNTFDYTGLGSAN